MGKEADPHLVVINVAHILFPLIILGIGSSVAFMVFLFEIWVGKTNEEAENQETDRSEDAIPGIL